ncbi:uncharacterized protein [Macrobrachium rosenbergii]|uniref:uncharacterized protein n=1 Tax=Macrobrachium rosenbergii TaxID=79674 RepID=UPI0034D46219
MDGRIPVLLLLMWHALITQGRHAREAAGCEFNGQVYQNDQKLPGCLEVHCIQGHWVPSGKISPGCNKCNAQVDTGLMTFDGWYYLYNGTCESALVQKGLSRVPEFGVFKEYSKCDHDRDCFGPSTFQDSLDTIIKMGSFGNYVPELYKVQVNGKPYDIMDKIPRPVKEGDKELPVLAWRHRGCIRMLGSSSLAIQRCATSLSIWAPSGFRESLFGLCGYYDGQPANDFTKRDRSSSPSQTFLTDAGFLESWAVQPSCAEKGLQSVRKRDVEKRTATCPLQADQLNLLIGKCNTLTGEASSVADSTAFGLFYDTCVTYICNIIFSTNIDVGDADVTVITILEIISKGGISSNTTRPVEISPSTTSPEVIPSGTTRPQEIPPSTTRPQEIPPSTTRPQEIPPSTTRPQEIPPSTTRPQEIPPRNSSQYDSSSRNSSQYDSSSRNSSQYDSSSRNSSQYDSSSRNSSQYDSSSRNSSQYDSSSRNSSQYDSSSRNSSSRNSSQYSSSRNSFDSSSRNSSQYDSSSRNSSQYDSSSRNSSQYDSSSRNSSQSTRPQEIPPSTTRPQEIPPSTTRPQEIPPSTTHPQEIPPSTTRPQEIPPSTTRPQEIPPGTPPPEIPGNLPRRRCSNGVCTFSVDVQVDVINPFVD